ncbi:MAG: sucrose phosphorylase [Bifidobacteriaceae bacterium]|jgi:sucrose phosphorylase|nr:sucrose phosphorylase [Bifidobacteriaceae bacterium]
MNDGAQLICYADRLAGHLPGLAALLDGPLGDFAGAHILPFFVPFDGPDTGFDPIDHSAVDPRLGSWADIRALADSGKAITADLIVNHMSAESAEFRDWLANGSASRHDGLFLRFGDVFPSGGTEAEITAFHRPRPGLPFTPYLGGDGRRRLVWTTFMPGQVDINVRHPAGRAHLAAIAEVFAASGVSTARIDAVGYAVKTPGTDSFMTPQTLDYIGELTSLCHSLGLRVLVEIHSHISQQLAVAPLVDQVYDFATPALILDALGRGAVDRLVEWDAIRPRNTVTVLDTHDGIGVIDAGPAAGRPGLLDQDEMAAIFRAADAATRGDSGRASVTPAWCDLPHQINSTFFDVLGREAETYALARAFQFFLPGTPQVYYVGLLAGANDVDLWRSTGEGRDLNRRRYSPEDLAAALDRPVVRAILGLVRLRREPVFAGVYDLRQLGRGRLELSWRRDADQLTLTADFAARRWSIAGLVAGRRLACASVEDLARLAGPAGS